MVLLRWVICAAGGGVALAVGGELAPEGDKQLRWRAAHPIEASDYAVHGMVFYRPERLSPRLPRPRLRRRTG